LLQGFTGVSLQLLAATGRVTGPPEIAAALHDVVTLAQRTLAGARRAVWDLRAPALEGADFSAVLRTAAEERLRGAGLALEYDVEYPERRSLRDADGLAPRRDPVLDDLRAMPTLAEMC